VLGTATSASEELAALMTVDGSLGGTWVTTAAPTVVIVSASARNEGKMEYVANAPDPVAKMVDILER